MIGSYSLPLSVLILGSSYLFWRYVKLKGNAVQKLPMVSSQQTSWIWGHELEIFQHEASEMYVKWAESFGLVYRVKAALFQSDIVIVGDNSAVQHILQNSDSYGKAPAFLRIIARLVGKGLVWAEGEVHRYQRRQLAPAFTSSSVEAMADDIFFCVDNMTQSLRSTLRGPNTVVDLVPVMSACTLDIIGRVGFGHDFEGGKSKEAKAISAAWHQDVIMLRTFAGFLAPILTTVFPWITRLPIPAFRDGVTRQIVHKLAGKLLIDDSKNMGGNDILSILLNVNQTSEEESQLTTTELLDNITTFFVAGHETTAVTTDFILLHLARNPSIQDKLRHEVRTVGSLDYNSIVELEYLNAVVKEGLRLHPVGPPTDRIAVHDDVIPLSQPIHTGNGEIISSLTIKAGQVFRIPWTLLNVNKQVWGNNGDEFVPERWTKPTKPGGIPSPDKVPHGPWAGVSSFSDGPRSCIGFRLGVLELKIIVAALVRSFEFKCTEAKITQHVSPTLQPFADGKAASMPLKVSLAPEM
ncbi:cytochrome P450 [Rhodocollybia butyracea]|uniref:Cytochrome P450 n=1 Tax=Rhodocollybia butyracea TaxID=206335 RepID=A0A9P5PUI4_9AGAR|nr:cytochrome P450 [Rhodocollybia butyracea]